jgi:hypothetical protein
MRQEERIRMAAGSPAGEQAGHKSIKRNHRSPQIDNVRVKGS